MIGVRSLRQHLLPLRRVSVPTRPLRGVVVSENEIESKIHDMVKHKSGPSEWVVKMLALIRSGNSEAAIAQIKAAPSAKDVAQLRAQLQLPKAPARHPNVDNALNDQVVTLASPRLHRAP